MSLTPSQMEELTQPLHQAHRNAINAELAARGLREVGHPMLLAILRYMMDEEQCLAQRELAERLHISPAAVANSLKSLERGGYILRAPGADARRNRVTLTERGRQAAADCLITLEVVSERMLDGFSQEEKALLQSFRQRMLHNLKGYVPMQSKEEC